MQTRYTEAQRKIAAEFAKWGADNGWGIAHLLRKLRVSSHLILQAWAMKDGWMATFERLTENGKRRRGGPPAPPGALNERVETAFPERPSAGGTHAPDTASRRSAAAPVTLTPCQYNKVVDGEVRMCGKLTVATYCEDCQKRAAPVGHSSLGGGPVKNRFGRTAYLGHGGKR